VQKRRRAYCRVSRVGEEAGLNVYIPLITMAGLGLLFAVFSVLIASLTGPKRYNRAKYDAYECGIEPTPQPLGGGKFPVKYYLTAMMFIIFDIEIVFLYPWAVAFDQLALFGFLAVLLFLVNLTIPYAYEWRRGGLDWD
jgi:NADH-quinone oxidoreductase subunit A